MNLTIHSINTRTDTQTHAPVSINFACPCFSLDWCLFSLREKSTEFHWVPFISSHTLFFVATIQQNPAQTSRVSQKRLLTKFHFKIGIAWLAHVICCTLFVAHCWIFVQLGEMCARTFIWFDKFTHKAFIIVSVIWIHWAHNKVMNNYRYQMVVTGNPYRLCNRIS